MTLPRKALISVSDTPYYHCVSRCVRRAFLCGVDHYSGKSYEHRREWLESLLLYTADVFAIKLCAYAVMSNHYHVVLNIRVDISTDWPDLEVVKRWHRLFKPTLFSQRFVDGEALSKTEWIALNQDIAKWRARLADISWFMRVVNERIARKANNEDNCTGRFWEGRFKSQALLDDQALLSCMAYVDLNPVRAGMANTPEQSNHTSIAKRILSIKAGHNARACLDKFVGTDNERIGIPFHQKDYLELVDWTGRIILNAKRGSINTALPPILERLDLSEDNWKTLTTEFEAQFQHWVGSEHIVRQVCEDKPYQRIPSIRRCQTLFS